MGAGLLVHIIRTLCYLCHDVEILKLHVMTPNKHMFKYYSKLDPELKENWEIFGEVVIELYFNIGKFEKSEKTFRDFKEYSDIIH